MARWDAAAALPEPARSKFRRLAGVAQDRQAATRQAYELVEEARERAGRARITYHLANRNLLASRVDPEGSARIGEPVAELEAEIRRLIQERDERGARQQSIVALVSRLDNFIGDLPRTTKIKLFSGPLPSRKKGEAPGDLIGQCRSEIEKLRDRITEISTAPRPLEDSIARATAEIEALAERGAPDVERLIDAGLGVDWPTRPLDLQARTPDGAVVPVHGSSIDVMATLAWLFKPALMKAVGAAIREANGDDADAIAVAARPKMIAGLRASLLELERTEETAIEEIEATGAAFERRADADPRAVLTLSSDLPAPRED